MLTGNRHQPGFISCPEIPIGASHVDERGKNAISWVHTACKTTPTGTLCARRLSDQIEQQSYWNLVVVSLSRPTLLLQHVGSSGTGSSRGKGSSPDASTVFATHLDPPPPLRTRAGRTSDPSASLRARAPRRRLTPAAPAAPSLSESVAEGLSRAQQPRGKSGEGWHSPGAPRATRSRRQGHTTRPGGRASAGPGQGQHAREGVWPRVSRLGVSGQSSARGPAGRLGRPAFQPTAPGVGCRASCGCC